MIVSSGATNPSIQTSERNVDHLRHIRLMHQHKRVYANFVPVPPLVWYPDLVGQRVPIQ